MFVSNVIMMAKIQLDVPNEIHIGVKQIQLGKESEGKKVNLKEVYYEVIKKGLEAFKKETPDQ